ncbi:hypothetical protein F5Y19DRAFT_492517 [Xylariaceae sp. FL1651]|nr:hypothetical protein F5Y19DRAFT_492517 [Xylariaceae sp. FL1651]
MALNYEDEVELDLFNYDDYDSPNDNGGPQDNDSSGVFSGNASNSYNYADLPLGNDDFHNFNNGAAISLNDDVSWVTNCGSNLSNYDSNASHYGSNASTHGSNASYYGCNATSGGADIALNSSSGDFLYSSFYDNAAAVNYHNPQLQTTKELLQPHPPVQYQLEQHNLSSPDSGHMYTSSQEDLEIQVASNGPKFLKEFLPDIYDELQEQQQKQQASSQLFPVSYYGPQQQLALNQLQEPLFQGYDHGVDLNHIRASHLASTHGQQLPIPQSRPNVQSHFQPQPQQQQLASAPEKKKRTLGKWSCESCRKDKNKCEVREGANTCIRCQQKGRVCKLNRIDKRTNQAANNELITLIKEIHGQANALGNILDLIVQNNQDAISGFQKAFPIDQVLRSIASQPVQVQYPMPAALETLNKTHSKLNARRTAIRQARANGPAILAFLESIAEQLVNQRTEERVNAAKALLHTWKTGTLVVPEGNVTFPNILQGWTEEYAEGNKTAGSSRERRSRRV